MFADKSLVRRRRLARRLKALASIGLAVVAGTFITCKQKADETMKAVDETRGKGADPDAAAVASTAAEGGPADADAGDTAMAPVAPKADAMVVAKDAAPKAAFDAKEHKKGMPVPDNLLE